MAESVEVAIVGAGQAGLATSWYLKQAGVEHVVLESSRVAETWRSRRWDSFCLVTPNWSVRLPGAEYAGPDPDGFMPLAELIDYFQHWADSFHAPVPVGPSADRRSRHRLVGCAVWIPRPHARHAPRTRSSAGRKHSHHRPWRRP